MNFDENTSDKFEYLHAESKVKVNVIKNRILQDSIIAWGGGFVTFVSSFV